MMKCKSNEGDYLLKFLSANTEIFQDYGSSLARQLANGISLTILLHGVDQQEKQRFLFGQTKGFKGFFFKFVKNLL